MLQNRSDGVGRNGGVRTVNAQALTDDPDESNPVLTLSPPGGTKQQPKQDNYGTQEPTEHPNNQARSYLHLSQCHNH